MPALQPAAQAYLRALAGPATSGWFDLRAIGRDGRVAHRFVRVTDVEAAAAFVDAYQDHRDVYVGVAIRTRRAGGRVAVDAVTTLWADCDTEESAARLATFRPAPSVIVRSGGASGRHAYWLLDEAVSSAAAERVNRALAAALGADHRCAHAAALLRPPQTLNHKYDPPTRATVESFTGMRHRLADAVAALPVVAEPATAPVAPTRPRARGRSVVADDPRNITPEIYVERMLGVRVPRSRKIHCPFHDDRQPSLHVYETPQRGWYCFGCRRGGSVYDLAAAVLGTSTRGRDFAALRRWVAAALT